jgi:hypothetical protein
VRYAGQQPLSERLADQDAHIVFVGEGEHALGPVRRSEEVVPDRQDVGLHDLEQSTEPRDLVATLIGWGCEAIQRETVRATHADGFDEALIAECAHCVEGKVQPAVVGTEVRVVKGVDVEMAGV